MKGAAKWAVLAALGVGGFLLYRRWSAGNAALTGGGNTGGVGAGSGAYTKRPARTEGLR